MIFVASVILVLLGALAYNLIRYIRGDIPYSTTAEIQEFTVCDVAYSHPAYIESVTVCGRLTTNGLAGLKIYAYGMPGEHLIGQNSANDEFQSGDFSRIIKLNNNETYNRYKIVVYLYRDVIATIEFKAKH